MEIAIFTNNGFFDLNLSLKFRIIAICLPRSKAAQVVVSVSPLKDRNPNPAA
jgi:hypothetical protein